MISRSLRDGDAVVELNVQVQTSCREVPCEWWREEAARKEGRVF